MRPGYPSCPMPLGQDALLVLAGQALHCPLDRWRRDAHEASLRLAAENVHQAALVGDRLALSRSVRGARRKGIELWALDPRPEPVWEASLEADEPVALAAADGA